MENLSLLEKFKKTESKTKAFIDIFKHINENYLNKNSSLDEKIMKELIELGDYCFKNNEKMNSCQEEEFLFQIYSQIKDVYKDYEDFETNCIEDLCDLKVDEVRELESLYSKINKEFDLKIIQISFTDGFFYNESFDKDFFHNDLNILKFKSLIARALRHESVIFFNFYNKENNNLISTSIVFQKGIWYPLSIAYNKQNNKYSQKFKNTKHIVLNK